MKNFLFLVRFISLLGFIFLFPFSGQANGEKKFRVLVVHSYDSDYVVYPDYNRLILENFRKEGVKVDLRIFYLDCEQYLEEPEKQRIYNYLDAVSAWQPDLILVNEDQATYSTLACGHPLVTYTPVVFSGVNFPNWNLLKKFNNVTGYWDRPDYLKTVNMVEELLGKTRIRFFYDNTFLGRQVTLELARQLEKKDMSLSELLYGYLIDSTTVNRPILSDVIPKKPGQSITRPDSTQFFFTNLRDNKGSGVLWAISGMSKYSAFVQTKYDFTSIRIGQMASIPTFTVINECFGYHQGVLGGYITTLDIQVEEAVKYAAQILKGKTVRELPISQSKKKYVVDWEELKRWSLSPDIVPARYEIVNMPFYQRHCIFILIGCILGTILIVSLITYLSYLYLREARQKKEAREHLRKEKEFLSLALEGNEIYAWKYEPTVGSFFFDKEFFENLNIPFRLFTLDQLCEVTHPDDCSQAVAQFKQLFAGLMEKAIIDCRCNFNGAGYIWYEFRYIRVNDSLRHNFSIIGLLLNIQDYKSREQELTQARDLAAKAELKQSFLANMSHEIRTPLNAIVGFSNLLIDNNIHSSEERQEFIKIINRNCELLLKLIEDILEISRIESGSMAFTFEKCNLTELVEEWYNTHQMLIHDKVQLLKEVPLQSFSLYTDRFRLSQVISNFINNAVKFTEKGYILIGYKLEEASRQVSIYVEDTGKGIPAHEQKMIFERFYKQDEFAQGTGLGLAICRGIVEKLGGQICLESKEGKGSRFSVVLSLQPEDKSIEKQTDTESASSSPKVSLSATTRPVILVAEDNESNYMLIYTLLHKDYEVIHVKNGKEAVEAMNEQRVNLILMDIKMPKMNGIEALKEIRKRYPQVPVIMQTAYAFDADREEAKKAGCNGFITKPILPEYFLTEIKKYFS